MKSIITYFAVIMEAATVLGGPGKGAKPDHDGRYTIAAPGIKAQFIPYGATLTNLFVKDKNGNDVDVVLGYDDVEYYPKDPGHPVYNAIPGRYANRIGKGKYTIDGEEYHTELNDGNNTLHSGTNNWSYRFWNVTEHTPTSITFAISDASNSSLGMLGRVDSTVTYSVSKNTWHIKMNAVSPERKTPVLLTQHTYFNLDAYKNPATNKIWDHTLYMPYSARYLEADQSALPTGKILTAAPGSINDFASAAGLALGHARDRPGFAGNCGANGACEGYNGYWLIEDKPSTDAVVVSLASPFSGVKADLRTDQPGVVLYSCNWMDGSAQLKSTQKLVVNGTAVPRTVGRSSCVAIEAQDYPDGINHPEWGRVDKQILGPGEEYSWESSWTFRLV
ncbi:galactose mutarotase-like protein [Neurospora crassa]|uniref:Aldose 1-epimerase n=1 Tax=Neurospora crassa (strain ATCC 24698 / 74-OR23-1A / CBS 708.71 / DSM 1257 / FGSC 987) TaxID=367110 RepID=Q7SC22_NEUCR|nr:aldose 1-epimerase [Neurospora crassa OR74A]EAA34001.2 aldose 1-epimerase [Neurospora crassa OR74A]KHE78985.1 galactose mutarotase-like protein [Neurospora crassa]|eukprot:XP_963237.2 aldose 1-epimerase [Neurospora crassa OR74A]